MRICIQTSRLELHAGQHERIERRVGFALSRLATQIRQVDVHLCDVNGPRGGIDKRCRVLVHFERGPAVVVEDFDSDIDDLVDRTLGRAGRSAHKRAALGTLRRRALAWPAGVRRGLGTAMS
jgi:hypothetical protein